MFAAALSNDVAIRLHRFPFRHVVMDNVFGERVYECICREFNNLIERGLRPSIGWGTFGKFGHYDAYGYTLDPTNDAFLAKLFYSTGWRQFVNGFFQLRLTRNVLAEFHHHLANSKSGHIHSDYDVTSFLDEPLANGLNPHRHKIRYRGRVNGAIQCVRSIAVLYYFNNRPWQEGSGGETAFYESDREDAKPVCLIEPRNNRALAFEVSPLSYHAFQTNRSVRSCLAMWFHSPERYCQRRYKKDPH